MSFEHLIWNGLTTNKANACAAVMGVAFAALGWFLASNTGLQPMPLGAAAAVVLLTSQRRARLRSERDRLLFLLGFSREQLATLLVLEAGFTGAVGAVFASAAALCLQAEGCRALLRLPPSDAALVATTESLLEMFVLMLVASVMGALLPARSLARSELGASHG